MLHGQRAAVPVEHGATDRVVPERLLGGRPERGKCAGHAGAPDPRLVEAAEPAVAAGGALDIALGDEENRGEALAAVHGLGAARLAGIAQLRGGLAARGPEPSDQEAISGEQGG